MKGQTIVLIALLCLSTRISANEDKNEQMTKKVPTPREVSVRSVEKAIQSPYYENEFTQDAYYQASRDIASFKIEESN